MFSHRASLALLVRQRDLVPLRRGVARLPVVASQRLEKLLVGVQKLELEAA